MRIIIISDSNTGALEFAQKLVSVLKVFNPDSSTRVVNGEQILDDFIEAGYQDTGSQDAAKARLKLREAFPFSDITCPIYQSVFRTVEDAGKVDFLIVCETTCSKMIDVIFDWDMSSDMLLYLKASEPYRRKEFKKKFPSVPDIDIDSYLYDCDMPVSGTALRQIDINTAADVKANVLELAQEIGLHPPTKCAEGRSLGDKIEEDVI